MLVRIFKYLIYPVLLVAATLYIYWALQTFDLGAAFILLYGYLGLAAIIFALEHIIPFEKSWNKLDRETINDILLSFFGSLFPVELTQFALRLALAAAAGWVASVYGGDIWPKDLPFWLQVVITLVVTEFGGYWAHRFRHEVPALWRLHALHHSADRLYWINTGRFHPFDIMVGQLFMYPWMVIVGVPAEVIVWASVYFQYIGLLSHCNVDMKFLPPFNWIFNTPHLHRWHHSRLPEEADTNYSPSFIFWDIIFGTYYNPKDRTPPRNPGIEFPMPRTFFAQIASPFTWRRIEQKAAQPAALPKE